MTKRTTYRLTVNSRPDAKGLTWFMVERSGDHYAAHLALYIESNRIAPPRSIQIESCILAGAPISLMAIVGAVSEWVTGNRHQAQLVNAEDGHHVNNWDGADVGPVLYFDVTREEEIADSADAAAEVR